jgi:hypothetical protein
VHVSDLDLSGWVVVVAGEHTGLGDVSRAASAAGAAVGLVSSDLGDDIPASVRFHADPEDSQAWSRIAMHIEQHLGPVDGVVTDEPAYATVQQVFAADLARRGRAPVFVVDAGTGPDTVITALFDTPPGGPSRPAAAPPDP